MSHEHGEDSNITLIDTSKALTLEELKELKQLASLSRLTRVVTAIAFGILTLFQIPEIGNWFTKLFH